MSLVSDHWPGVEKFELNGKEYQLSIEEVQAQEKWMDEKKRELSPFASSGFTILSSDENSTCKAMFLNPEKYKGIKILNSTWTQKDEKE